MLEVNNVCVSFRSERQEKIFGTTRNQVLFDVSLKVSQGTCLGILGESGSGKSTLGRVICGLLKPDTGEVKIQDVSVYASRNGRKNLQKRLSVVFQDYTTSANPRFRVKEIIAEGLAARERNQKIRLDRLEETNRLLELVGLDSSYANRYPHELSGGQLQRVCIARAVACQPEIILFDEAISSLDAHTQVQIMDLLHELKEKLGLTYIFITHDLSVVKYFSDDIAVMYLGQMVEKAPAKQLFANPQHPYTKALLSAIPVPDPEFKTERIILQGELTSPINPGEGCRFARRCIYASEMCFKQNVALKEVEKEHFVACHLVEQATDQERRREL